MSYNKQLIPLFSVPHAKQTHRDTYTSVYTKYTVKQVTLALSAQVVCSIIPPRIITRLITVKNFWKEIKLMKLILLLVLKKKRIMLLTEN